MKKKLIAHNIIIIFTILLPLLYTILRAIQIPFSHDESLSFNLYENSSLWGIITLSPPSSNNHVINTLLMQLFSSILGNSEFVLRLGVIIAHLFYNIYLYKIARLLKLDLLFTIVLILLSNANPYLLQFFSVARGYGIAIAFMIVTLYYFLKTYLTGNKRFAVHTYIFAFLMVYSHFSFLYVWFSLIIVDIVLWYLKEKPVKLRKLLIDYKIKGFIIGLSAILFYFPIETIVEINEIKSRMINGLWNETVISFIRTFIDDPSSLWFKLSKLMLISLLTLICLTSIQKVINHQNKKINHLTFALFLLLVLPALFSYLNFLIMDAEFLVYRKTIFFYPLLIVNLILLFLPKVTDPNNRIYKYVVFIIGILLVSNTLIKINLTYISPWLYDAANKKFIQDIINLRGEKEGVRVGITWYFEPALNYYRETKNLTWLNEFQRHADEKPYDYYYFQEDYYYTFEIDPDTLEIIKRYPVSNTFLAKPLN